MAAHAALGERLQALDAGPPLAGAPDPGQDRPLLDAEAHARAWVAFVLGDEHFASLRPLDWEAVGAAVHHGSSGRSGGDTAALHRSRTS